MKSFVWKAKVTASTNDSVYSLNVLSWTLLHIDTPRGARLRKKKKKEKNNSNKPYLARTFRVLPFLNTHRAIS